MYRTANREQRTEGKVWYETAHKVAKSIHPSDIAGAGVLAALSPQITWTENVRGAELICYAALRDQPIPDVAGYNVNRLKAWKIARGEFKVSPLEIIQPNPVHMKTANFYRNIMGDTQAVTVDRWSARIALPVWCGQCDVKGKDYLEIERAYQLAANRLHLAPSTLQAITWLTVRAD